MKVINVILIILGFFVISCNLEKKDNTPSVQETEKETSKVIVYSAPENEILNTKYKVSVEGENSPVYDIKVASESRATREKAKNDIPASTDLYEVGGMTYFDIKEAPVEVTVAVDELITEAKVFSGDRIISSQIKENSVSFLVEEPMNITVAINGDRIRSLQLFVNEEETDIPDPKDPNVVYFGPGSYRFPIGEIEEGMTVYVAGGAVVRCYVGPHEWYTINPVTKQKNYNKFYMLDLIGKNIKIKGRGIIDQDGIPTHSRRMVRVQGENINIEDVIFRNPSEWGFEIIDSENVTVDNVKMVGHRAQTNAFNVISSKNITIKNSFIRTFGEPLTEKESQAVMMENCIIWNDGETLITDSLREHNFIYSPY